ncbi:MAG TPA: nucleotide exchange factor GrpE [Jiangellales bacterium]|nr:nucleotide exchange factor GrpE [Jiangellales bacterium]
MSQEERNEQGEPVIRDRRRIDPLTGRVRGPSPSSGPAPAGPAGGDGGNRTDRPDEGARMERELAEEIAGIEDLGQELDQARREAGERLEDLRRLQAEYINYRRRVERDREAVRDNAVANVLAELLPVLDDIGRAREHGDLNGGFKSVGEALEQVTAKLGLVRYGEPGDEFDPTVHEALMHGYADDIEVPTCTEVLMPGYRFGERVIRPARVAVAEPTAALPDGGDTQA